MQKMVVVQQQMHIDREKKSQYPGEKSKNFPHTIQNKEFGRRHNIKISNHVQYWAPMLPWIQTC